MISLLWQKLGLLQQGHQGCANLTIVHQISAAALVKFYLEVILLGEGLMQPATEILQRVLLYNLLIQQSKATQISNISFQNLENIHISNKTIKDGDISPLTIDTLIIRTHFRKPPQWCSASSPTPWELELPSLTSSESKNGCNQDHQRGTRGRKWDCPK